MLVVSTRWNLSIIEIFGTTYHELRCQTMFYFANWQLVFTKPTADFVLFVFVMCLVYTMLPVSLDCPFLIASSVFSNACVLVPWYDTEILTLGSCSIWLLFCLVDPSVQCSLCCAISHLHLDVHLWSFLWEHALFLMAWATLQCFIK